MNTAFIETLDATTRHYLRQALSDSDDNEEVREKLAGLLIHAAEAAQDVEAGAKPVDALAFTHSLNKFIDEIKTRALEARRLESDIEAKQREVAKTQAEIEELSASMPALAVAVNQAFDKHEEARRDYNAQEFKIATLSTRLSMRRGELTELRRRLAQIKTQEAQA